jgi:flagellar M-ring protein FliF
MAFLEQIKKLAAALSLRQKISLALAVVAVAGGLFWFARWRTDRDYTVLARGLSAEDAGQVVARLKETGVDYRVDSSDGTVRVRSAAVAELRLQLAAEGLPKTGRAGFELFDKVNLGTTEFAEKINFQRALEGELERSVGTLGEVRAARIHLTPPKDSIFLDHREPAKASVLLTLKDGASLNPKNIQAITHLVASAVDGLTPDAVSILDSQGNLLSRPRKNLTSSEAPEDAILEFRQAIERDLLAKIRCWARNASVRRSRSTAIFRPATKAKNLMTRIAP